MCCVEACEDGVTPAVRSVKFYGVVYDRDILAPTGEVEKASAQVWRRQNIFLLCHTSTLQVNQRHITVWYVFSL